ncbi:pxb [Carabus blaptoides fortunei]
MERPEAAHSESSPAASAVDFQQAEAMWAMETGAGDCDCPGPPPEFLLPPPPRPPFLQDMYCSEDPLPDLETCDALPLIDASYRSSPSFQTSAVIALCSILLGLFVFIGIILVWKHKRKVQNFLPCKTSPQNNCDGSNPAGVIYEDLSDVIPRPTPTHNASGHIVAPSIEMIDVKSNIHYPSGYPMTAHPPVFLCSSPGPDPYCSQDLYNPVYEELSDADSEMAPAPASEDEFAEDELSLAGDAERSLNMQPQQYRPDLAGRRDMQQRYRRPQEPLPPIPGARRHRSLERRNHEFHEGMLLDALLQFYPRIGSVGPPGRRPVVPSITQRIQCLPTPAGPYETVPVLGHLATFRPVPKPYSQDSAFGSDSGYSNHTSGTRGSNRGRRDPRRLSQLSADLA